MTVPMKSSKNKQNNPSSSALVPQAQLLMFVRAALEGPEWGKRNARERPENPVVNQANMQEKAHELAEFLTIFAEAMGENFTNKDCVHLTAKG